MRIESAEQKFNRLRDQIQSLVLTSYPNPQRRDCPGDAAILEYAERAVNWEEVEDHLVYRHITHCSPCYREFLDATEELRASRKQEPAKRMPWLDRRRMRRTLDQLEGVMKSVMNQGRGTGGAR